MVMRKFCLLIAAIMLLAGCSKEMQPESIDEAQQVIRTTLEVGLDNAATRTALGTELSGKFPVVWTDGDEIAVVENMGTAAQHYTTYRLKSGAGTAQGLFEYVSGDAYPAVITDVVYPASAMKPASVDLNKVPVTDPVSLVPLEQHYTAGSFDPAAAVMHYHNATGKEEPILLKPIVSIVCIPLKGKAGDIVTSVRWQHFDGHTRTFDLICPEEGIELSDQVTNFYIAVSPMYYDAPDENTKSAANCAVKVNLANGAVQVKTPSSKTFRSGEFHRFPEWTLSRKSRWTFKYIGSERDDATWHQIPMGPARYMIDGDDRSWWEFRRVLNDTKSNAKMAKHHKFIIDLGQIEHITGMKFKSKEDKTSPKYGIKTNSGADIYGSQSYNPPYNVKLLFAKDLNDVATKVEEFKKFPDAAASTWVQEEHHCTSKNGIAYYYGNDMKKWWSFNLKTPQDARYIIMHVSHGWNNAGTASALSMLKIAEMDIF